MSVGLLSAVWIKGMVTRNWQVLDLSQLFDLKEWLRETDKCWTTVGCLCEMSPPQHFLCKEPIRCKPGTLLDITMHYNRFQSCTLKLISRMISATPARECICHAHIQGKRDWQYHLLWTHTREERLTVSFLMHTYKGRKSDNIICYGHRDGRKEEHVCINWCIFLTQRIYAIVVCTNTFQHVGFYGFYC